MRGFIFITFLLICQSTALFAKEMPKDIPRDIPRDIPTELSNNWKEKAVFFGVNKAWDYLPQEHTLLTYLARDEAFNYKTFSEEKYFEGLTKAREMGLKLAGIKNWKILKKKLIKISDKKILIKLSGTYLVKRGLVRFTEWQLFTGEEYHQVALIENKDAYSPLSKKQLKNIFHSLLGVSP